MEVFVFAGQTWLCAWKRAVGRHPLHAFVWHKGPGPHWGMGSEVWEKAEKTKRTSPMVQHGAFDLMLFNAFYIFYIIIIFFSTSQEWVGFDLILIAFTTGQWLSAKQMARRDDGLWGETLGWIMSHWAQNYWTRHDPFFRPMFEASEFSQSAQLVTASVMQIEQKVMFETSTKMTPQKDEYKELRRRM